jgi:DNA modification methylase
MQELIHGEALEEMDRLIERGVVVDAIITDPPYGTTACKWDAVIPFEPMWERLNKLIKPNGAIVLFGSEPFSSALRMSNIKNYKYDWVWNKVNRFTNMLNVNRQPLRIYENISVFYKKQCTYNKQMKNGKPYKAIRTGKSYEGNGAYKIIDGDNNGFHNPKNIIDLKSDNKKENGLHPTQKPVALMEYLIKTYTNEGEIVLDFTMGSGTTGVAARNLSRQFIGIERDNKYFKIANDRILAKTQGSLF